MQTYSAIDLNVVLKELLEEMWIPAGSAVRSEISTQTLGMGDRDTYTLLTQLISNALKHHYKGQGDVLVTLGDDNNAIMLRVSDDGPGINREFHNEVLPR